MLCKENLHEIHIRVYSYRVFLENSEAGARRSLCVKLYYVSEKELTVRSETQSSRRVVFAPYSVKHDFISKYNVIIGKKEAINLL